MSKTSVDHFAVLGLSLSSSECEAEVDLVLIQISFVFLWKIYLCMILVSIRSTSFTSKGRIGCIKTRSTSASFLSITVK